MAALVAAQRAAHGIACAVSCRALGVSRSWFYKHKNGWLAPRAARRQRLKAEVARLFGLHQGTYGLPLGSGLGVADRGLRYRVGGITSRERHVDQRNVRSRPPRPVAAAAATEPLPITR